MIPPPASKKHNPCSHTSVRARALQCCSNTWDGICTWDPFHRCSYHDQCTTRYITVSTESDDPYCTLPQKTVRATVVCTTQELARYALATINPCIGIHLSASGLPPMPLRAWHYIGTTAAYDPTKKHNPLLARKQPCDLGRRSIILPMYTCHSLRN